VIVTCHSLLITDIKVLRLRATLLPCGYGTDALHPSHPLARI